MNISISVWISRYLYACRYLCVFIDICYIHKGQVPRWSPSTNCCGVRCTDPRSGAARCRTAGRAGAALPRQSAGPLPPQQPSPHGQGSPSPHAFTPERCSPSPLQPERHFLTPRLPNQSSTHGAGSCPPTPSLAPSSRAHPRALPAMGRLPWTRGGARHAPHGRTALHHFRRGLLCRRGQGEA